MDEETIKWKSEFAEAYLEPLRTDGRKLRRMKAELIEQRDILSGLRGIDYTQPFVDVAAYNDAVHDAVARIMEMESAYEDAIANLDGRRAEARTRLDEMPGTEADLLRLYYVSALPWALVGEALNLAEGTCRNMRRGALAAFYDHLPRTERPPEQHAI